MTHTANVQPKLRGSTFADLRLLAQSLSTRLAIVVAAGAVALGIEIGTQKLVIAAVTLALPVVVLAPVQATLGTFALMIPFDQVLTVSQDVTITYILGAAAGLGLLAYGLVTDRLEMPSGPAWWWVAFAAWTCLSVFWAVDPELSMRHMPTAVGLLLLYLAAASFRITRSELRAVAVLLTIGGAIAAIWALYQFAHGLTDEFRASVILGQEKSNPNDFASTLLMPFSLAFSGFLAGGPPIRRVLLLLVAELVGACVLLTMSRGSIVALGALILIVCWRARVSWRMFVPIAVLGLLLLAVPNLFFSRFENAFSSRAQGRFDIWMVGLQIVRHYPALGVGFENFRVGYDQFASYAPNFRGFDRAPHNIYLETWAETGILGLALLAGAIWSHLKAARPAPGERDYLLIGIEAACWAIVVHGLAANHLWRKQFWMSWMLVMLISKTRSVVSEHRQTSVAPVGLSAHLQTLDSERA